MTAQQWYAGDSTTGPRLVNGETLYAVGISERHKIADGQHICFLTRENYILPSNLAMFLTPTLRHIDPSWDRRSLAFFYCFSVHRLLCVHSPQYSLHDPTFFL